MPLRLKWKHSIYLFAFVIVLYYSVLYWREEENHDLETRWRTLKQMEYSKIMEDRQLLELRVNSLQGQLERFETKLNLLGESKLEAETSHEQLQMEQNRCAEDLKKTREDLSSHLNLQVFPLRDQIQEWRNKFNTMEGERSKHKKRIEALRLNIDMAKKEINNLKT
jgi:chromosome segregation ATPase